jgi:VWFA-related protein
MYSHARLSVTFAVVTAASTLGYAQFTPVDPSPALSGPPASTPAQSSQTQSPPSQVATLKANAQLVVVDVVVTDRSHKPVHGLKISDFELGEAGVPQTLKNFEEHTAPTAADAARFPPMPVRPRGIFTNYTPAPTNGAVSLILLDALNTPMKDQAFARQQLFAYLKAVPPGTRIAIFGLTTRLTALQDFTSDPETLKTVLAHQLSKGSPLLDDPAGDSGIQNSQADVLEDAGIDPGVVANLRDFEAHTQSFQLHLRAKYTLDAMNQIARYLSDIPGRKNLIWFSGSFPVNILPDTTGTLTDPFAAMASSEAEFRETVDLLARSQVAVYPIDARGLTTPPMFNASTNRNYSGPNGDARVSQDLQKYFNDTAAEQGTMVAMADATGGRAFLNTNGLTQAVAEAIDDGSNFYTLSYTPTNSEYDGKLRKIKIEVARQDLTLAYRKGYYADDLDKVSHSIAKPDAALTAANGLTSEDTMRLAMSRGAPLPSQILIKVGVLPINPADKPEDNPAVGNNPAAKTHGPYRRYSVNYAIDPRYLTLLRSSDGMFHSDFDLIIFVFDTHGEMLNSTRSTVHLNATLDQIKQVFSQGIIRHEEISAPLKGEYFLRIAVHDLHQDHYGAVEVATSTVHNLVAPKPTASAAPEPAPAQQ